MAVRAVYIPTLRKSAKDGAPEILWLVERCRVGHPAPRVLVSFHVWATRHPSGCSQLKGGPPASPVFMHFNKLNICRKVLVPGRILSLTVNCELGRRALLDS